jgi:hypothetical protein
VFQCGAECQIARGTDSRNPDLLAFEIGGLPNAAVDEQRKHHLTRRGTDPDEVRTLSPRCKHWRGRKMAELNFAREQRLHCCRSATDIDQIAFEAVFAENSGVVRDPEASDSSGKGAVSDPNGR